jgi:hypothetical protein
MKTFIIVVALAIVMALAIYAAVEAWTALADTTISTHGWIALGAGVLVTLAVGGGLMFLVFYSNRQGYDDPDNRQD